MRRSVDAQHRHVRSRPDDDVTYDAYDADLQLWVAACMYVGSLQGYETLYGRADETHDQSNCWRAAVASRPRCRSPRRQWPRDRAAFAAYWSSAMTQVEIDEVTART